MHWASCTDEHKQKNYIPNSGRRSSGHVTARRMSFHNPSNRSNSFALSNKKSLTPIEENKEYHDNSINKIKEDVEEFYVPLFQRLLDVAIAGGPSSDEEEAAAGGTSGSCKLVLFQS